MKTYPSHNSQPSARMLPQRDRKTWAILMLAMIGLAAAGACLWQALAERASSARAAMLLAETLSSFQSIATEPARLANGDASALDRFQSARAALRQQLPVLANGGFPDSSGGVSIPPATPQLQGVLGQANAALATIDGAMRAVVENAATAREVQQAQQQFNQSLSQLPERIALVRAQPAFQAGRWENVLSPMLNALDRPELSTLPVIFSPIPGGAAVQKPWAEIFAARARELEQLPGLARQDAQVPATASDALLALHDTVAVLGNTAPLLHANYDLRRSLWEAGGVVSQAASPVVLSLTQALRQATPSLQALSWLVWTGLAGLALSVVSVLLLARQGHRLRRENQQVTMENQSGSMVQEHYDRLARRLRKLQEAGDIEARLNEDPDSPAFTLASMVDRFLEARAQSANLLRQRLAEFHRQISAAREATGAAMSNSDTNLNFCEHGYMMAQELASSLKRVVGNTQNIVVYGGRMGDKLEEGDQALRDEMWRMEEVRRAAQENAKRLKRLGESAQGIHVVADVLHQVSRRIQVLSMNAAIQAAAAGELGRDFAVLAQEIQRLAENANISAEEVDQIAKQIQADSKEAIHAMEKSTHNVVETGNSSARTRQALSMLKNLSSAMNKLSQRVHEEIVQASDASNRVEGNLSQLLSAIPLERSDMIRSQDILSQIASLGRELARSEGAEDAWESDAQR